MTDKHLHIKQKAVLKLSVFIIGLIITILLFSFQSHENIKTDFNISPDTIKLSLEKHSLNEYQFEFFVRNSTRKALNVFFCVYGYKGDVLNSYYLEILKAQKDTLEIYEVERRHYSEVMCPVTDTIPPNESKRYNNYGYLYPLKKTGKYYIRLVFCNEMAFLGKTNYDSVVVIE